MEKSTLFKLTLSGLLLAGSLRANSVGSSTAKTVAQNFFQSLSSGPPSAGQSYVATLVFTAPSSYQDTALYYIFNFSPDGFVIVSACDAITPILGYSLKGQYHTGQQSPEFSYYMNCDQKHIQYDVEHNNPASVKIKNAWTRYSSPPVTPLSGAGAGISAGAGAKARKNPSPLAVSVAPLLQTTWNQSPYYNELCPGGSVTGCVATAQAQIMKYWAFPAQGMGSYTYNDPPYGNLSANFDTTHFNWAAMPLNLDSDNAEVAILMYECGVAVNMAYSPSGSGANSANFTTYFGYNPNTLNVLYRNASSDAVWMSVLSNELNNRRPVNYMGQGADGGHSWVCDGYDSIENFHMNWGWGGYMDAYYAVQIDSTSDYLNSTFNDGQELIIGIEPPAGVQFSASQVIACSSTTVHFNSTNLTNKDTVTGYQWLFPGGSPPSSGISNPTVSYSTPGIYNVTEIVSGTLGSDTIAMPGYVCVLPSVPNPLPLSEGFQESNFPPAGWFINNPDNYATTWQQTLASNDIGGYQKSSQCMFFNNCDPAFDPAGQRQQIYTPNYDFSAVTNAKLYFDVAYAPYSEQASDTLAVYYSTDCGTTFNLIYLKGGLTLGTAGDSINGTSVNTFDGGCFKPLNKNWRTDTISLSALNGFANVLFSFENRSGFGSNLYIDNVNIPATLTTSVQQIQDNNLIKIYPNPSNGLVTIETAPDNSGSGNSIQPNTLLIQITDMLGRFITDRLPIETAKITLDLSSLAKGVYSIQLTDIQNKVTSRQRLVLE